MDKTDMEGSPDREEMMPKKRKRGVRNSESYTRNVIKQSRIRGKGYLSYKGKEVAERKVGEACR